MGFACIIHHLNCYHCYIGDLTTKPAISPTMKTNQFKAMDFFLSKQPKPIKLGKDRLECEITDKDKLDGAKKVEKHFNTLLSGWKQTVSSLFD